MNKIFCVNCEERLDVVSYLLFIPISSEIRNGSREFKDGYRCAKCSELKKVKQ